ncbi:type III-B CRISPR module RAMP protein Cmr4 [Coleofasciculus sp. E2-BRE-01]|jgi:CRISPR-associated protein Cmr4|uniref:type III-B CRISPR module RAMP protein Cmr4 n=1 Tax=Coleofasciculus sp. E2-BRE-01 TaxID=3069524 RepID=UPI003300E51D
MYKKAYGVIETLAPLHVGATAGEESGNLNLIFKDQFTQTGIIPGSSIRGRLRSQMRQSHDEAEASYWYGHEAESELSEKTTESVVKFEYASILWLPVFCPGQPIVWVSCPKLLKRYKRIAGNLSNLPDPERLKYKGSQTLTPLNINGENKLFFNFGFLTVEGTENLSAWFPLGNELPSVVVGDDEIGMIHDMALYRQSRVALEKNQKRVKGKAFFNTEALPEGTFMVFPIAIKQLNPREPNGEPKSWQPFGKSHQGDVYLGGLESIGFGHCEITVKGV